jgi:hypothetical protein
MDTLARVKCRQGSKDEAMTLEQKALDLASASAKYQFQEALDSFKKGEIPKAE